MPKAYSSAVIPAPVEAVWDLVSDFNGLPSWHPAITDSKLTAGASAAEIGAVRDLTLGDGGRVVERLVSLDNDEHTYSYVFVESPFPVRSYYSTIRLAPVTAGDQTFAEWTGLYDSEAADEEAMTSLFANGVYAAGLAALVKHFTNG
ncbi:SRPBCC family protein [Fodinicola acaciae]|uniref:SRPBCC family protein n=1 Tax=Fodinicola acaciae TaxID=2681555 RepID=UPI0013D16C5F|nr:SRPBCC family protein [Fodinicola acaciae]